MEMNIFWGILLYFYQCLNENNSGEAKPVAKTGPYMYGLATYFWGDDIYIYIIIQ